MLLKSSGISFALSKKNFGTFPHFAQIIVSSGTNSSFPDGERIGEIRLKSILVSNTLFFSEHSIQGACEMSIRSLFSMQFILAIAKKFTKKRGALSSSFQFSNTSYFFKVSTDNVTVVSTFTESTVVESVTGTFSSVVTFPHPTKVVAKIITKIVVSVFICLVWFKFNSYVVYVFEKSFDFYEFYKLLLTDF